MKPQMGGYVPRETLKGLSPGVTQPGPRNVPLEEESSDLEWPPALPDDRLETPPRKCRRHLWGRVILDGEAGPWTCARCGHVRDEVKARRGKQSRNYGNRAELAVARTYGGTKIGHAGGPVDVRGKDFATQVKTHRRPPPREWTGAFQAMSASKERVPRLLLRFVMGPGLPPRDYFVFEAGGFLDWFGKDEEG